MRFAGFFLLSLFFLLGIGGVGTAEAALPTNKVVARVFARWLEQEAPQASAAEGKVARALAAALVEIADGGDINATDKTGHTALMMAAAIDHRPAIDFLLLSGADPYLKNAKGRTALDMAKQNSIRELIKASAIMDKEYSPAELEQLKVEVDEALKKLKPAAANGIDLVGRNEAPWELFAKCLKCGKLLDADKAEFTVRVFAFHGIYLNIPDLTLLALKTGMDPSEEFVFQHPFTGISIYKTTPLNMAISNGGWGVLQFRKVSQAVATMADVKKISGAWGA